MNYTSEEQSVVEKFDIAIEKLNKRLDNNEITFDQFMKEFQAIKMSVDVFNDSITTKSLQEQPVEQKQQQDDSNAVSTEYVYKDAYVSNFTSRKIQHVLVMRHIGISLEASEDTLYDIVKTEDILEDHFVKLFKHAIQEHSDFKLDIDKIFDDKTIIQLFLCLFSNDLMDMSIHKTDKKLKNEDTRQERIQEIMPELTTLMNDKYGSASIEEFSFSKVWKQYKTPVIRLVVKYADKEKPVEYAWSVMRFAKVLQSINMQ